jgi:hypothetical protein
VVVGFDVGEEGTVVPLVVGDDWVGLEEGGGEGVVVGEDTVVAVKLRTPVSVTDVTGRLEAVVSVEDIEGELLGEERVDGLKEELVATDEFTVRKLEIVEEGSWEDVVGAEEAEEAGGWKRRRKKRKRSRVWS